MPPAPAHVAALLAALVAASAGISDEVVESAFGQRSIKSIGPPSLPPGCLYEGRWSTEGATVPTGEACLHCACFHGALTCRRRACAPLPDPPPHRCHVLHRRGSCCPELHCPDGIILMEQGASARLESDDDIAAPSSVTHACVEGGTIYAAGSAMRSSVACEQCFCLRGARRCVRPRCLPPPAGCRARPAPGACCPQRYYCDHRTTKPPEDKHPHDCKIDSKWITEGERVASPKADDKCTQCFCLRGAAQCQPLSCAPALLGCKPLLRPGECCAHQYQCEHKHHVSGSHILTLSNNALTSVKSDDRAFHTSKSNKQESTTKNTLANIFTVKNTPTLTATKNHLVSTTKVKRKTSDPPPDISSQAPVQNTTVTPTTTITTQEPTTLAKLLVTTEAPSSTTDITIEATSTEQPEGSVRIMINGTINCTAELSSTSLPLNITFNDTERITSESHPRIPLIDVSNLEDHTFSANDIITDRTVNGGFDENESFIINVTSSLVTNTSRTSMRPPVPTVSKVSLSTDIVEALNSSKKTKGDYDYDYIEPTLPPSLPNLKIIPFVAADAVVDDEHPKETLTYPILEREDKFPVYYPSVDTKDSTFATRREDVYRPTKYPVFITDKPDHEQYPSLSPDVDLTNSGYSNVHTDLDSSVNEFTVSASLGNHVPDIKSVTQQPLTTTTFKLETPVVNLFSPPVETEGGFVPKGPTGIIDEYFAVFPSTPSAPSVPHLTTSMQLDIAKEECVSGDGRHVPEGNTITLACSECTCAWGALRCSPRPCPSPAGCRRRPASSNTADLCCGELICDEDNKTTLPLEVTTAKISTTEITELKNNMDTVVKIDSVTDNRTSLSNNTIKIDTPNRNVETLSHFQDNLVKTAETVENVTTTSTTTVTPTTEGIITTSAVPVYKATTQSINQSFEYEEEEEEDEGFSFGSVLKLLLSDNYETTTVAPKRLPTTTRMAPSDKIAPTTRKPRPTLPPFQPPKPSIAPFVPLPAHPYNPPNKNQNPINRIDHLVLGEATAIRKTTHRPITTTFRSVTTNRPSSRPTTQRTVTIATETTKEETYTTQEAPRPPGGLPGLGPSLLKLAGCNIYGRMYRVGRIITELSTPCQECWCTEFGVQCKQLKC